MGGESHGNGNANAYHATSRGVYPPAKAAHGRSAKGGVRGSFAEKWKFTVIVNDQEQWSSVRDVNETLEEFAAAIVRDVRRLVFGDNDDSIQRLQLDWSEYVEPSEKAGLGKVTISCEGDEQLLAIVKRRLANEDSTQRTPSPRVPRTGIPKQRPNSESTPQSTNAIASNCNVSVAAPSSSPDLLAPRAAPKFSFPDYKPPCRSALRTDPRASNNYIPPESPSLQFQPVERAWSFHPDYVAGAGANLPPLPRSSGKLNRGGANNAKRSLRGATKPPSSSNSSASVRNSLTSPDGGFEIMFPVHRRRSKTGLQGVGTHYLKMLDISAFFHLTLLNAAKKLGVSQTTLKKACRYFKLQRWPGRKVRSLLRTTKGLLHESVVGQGAGLEEMTKASMRSDVRKLPQEMSEASMRSDDLKLLQEMDQLFLRK